MRFWMIPTWLQEFEKEADYNMNWKRWLKYNPYKKLWSLIGGRKWTHIMRDFAYRSPLLLLLLAFGFGLWMRPHVDWDDLWKAALALLLGHVLWGARWIPGQGKDGYPKGGQ